MPELTINMLESQ